MTDATPRRSNAVLAAFAGPCLPYAAIGLPLAVHLPAFYSQYVGLSLGLVSLAFFTVRCVDIFFDPVVGWAMDRTRNRWGPYRTWITLGTPILAGAVAAIFFVKPGADFSFLFAWLLVLYLGFSIVTLAQLAWGSVLAPQYDERSRLYGWWQAANIVGVLIALAIPAVVQNAHWGSYEDGVRAMGWFIVIALPVTLLINLLGVPEPQNQKAKPHGGLSAYISLFKRPVVRKILVCDLYLGLAPGITGALLFFYFESVKGFERSQSQIFMAFYFLAGLLGAPLWSWLATKFGKDRALQIASVVFALLYLSIAFFPAGNFLVNAVGLAIVGVPYAAGLLLTRAMMADVADEVRLETGEDRTGLLFSFLSLTTKLGYAISVGCLSILELVHFDQAPGAHNSDVALWTLQGLFIVLPTALLVLSAWALHKYPLTAARHAEIRHQLAERDRLALDVTAQAVAEPGA
jgi:GPH family glycoside/pentoside/hexuronide:cation symporter